MQFATAEIELFSMYFLTLKQLQNILNNYYYSVHLSTFSESRSAYYFYTSLPTTMWFSRGSDLCWFCSLIHSESQDTSLEQCWHTQVLNKYLININMCKTNDYVYMFGKKYKNEVTISDEIKLYPKRYDSYKKKKCR